MKKSEILAPVGNMKMCLAAIHGGADAIYVGMPGFNARGRTHDHSIEELKEMLIEGEQSKVEGYLPDLNNRLHKLEQDAVEKFYLGEVLADLKVLANSDKSDVLPSVFVDAKNAAELAQAFARNNVRQYQDIEAKTLLAQLQVKRINSLFSEHISRKEALKDDTVEVQLLGLEKQIYQLTQKAGLGDLRHLSFTEQLAELNKAN